MIGIAAALRLGLGAGAAAIGVAVAENFIGWDPRGTAAPDFTTDSTRGSVTTNKTVQIASGAAKGDVYKYIGSGSIAATSLKTQDYTDATKWQQLGTTAAGETKAYVSSSSVVAATTLNATATSGETITAVVAAASVALAGGGIAVAAAGAGVYVLNRIGQATQAYISGNRGIGINVTGSGGQAISLQATDTSTITALGGAAAVGVGDRLRRLVLCRDRDRDRPQRHPGGRRGVHLGGDRQRRPPA